MKQCVLKDKESEEEGTTRKVSVFGVFLVLFSRIRKEGMKARIPRIYQAQGSRQYLLDKCSKDSLLLWYKL